MSRAKVTINSDHLLNQIIGKGFQVIDSPSSRDIVLDVCADCVVFEKEPRTVTQVTQELINSWYWEIGLSTGASSAAEIRTALINELIDLKIANHGHL